MPTHQQCTLINVRCRVRLAGQSKSNVDSAEKRPSSHGPQLKRPSDLPQQHLQAWRRLRYDWTLHLQLLQPNERNEREGTWSFVPVEMPRPTCPRACGAFGTARPSRTPCVSITNGTSKHTPRSRLAAGESLIPCVSILADNVRNAFELSSDGDTHCRSAAPACRSSSEPKFRADQAAAGGLRHVLSLTASCALSAIIGIPGLALPAHAITTEQLLFLEAWRAIDRAYVDKGFNNQSWFKVRLIRHDAHAHNRVLLQAQLMFQDCITILTILLCSYENST